MGLLIKVENGSADLDGISDEIILAASRVGYWALDASNHVETDSDGVIQAINLTYQSDHASSLPATTRISASSVNSIKVGMLTTNGVFSAYLSS